MDTITHTVAGVVLGEASPKTLSEKRSFLLACAITANLPDIDSLSWLFGAKYYFASHRGWAHSAFLIPILGIVGMLLFMGISKKKTFSLKAWAIFSSIAASHLFLDCLTSYGTQLLMPFTTRRFSLHIMPIIDIWTLAILVLFAIAALLNSRNRRVLAFAGLAIFSAYIGFRFWAKCESEKIVCMEFAEHGKIYSFPNISSIEDWANPSSYRVAIFDGDSAESFLVYPIKSSSKSEGRSDIIDKNDLIFSAISNDPLIASYIKMSLMPIYSFARDTLFISDLRYSKKIGANGSFVIAVPFVDSRTIGKAKVYRKRYITKE